MKLCGILCSDSIAADDSNFLVCCAVSLCKFLVFQKITVPSPSASSSQRIIGLLDPESFETSGMYPMTHRYIPEDFNLLVDSLSFSLLIFTFFFFRLIDYYFS
jgi:hypothetical protein